MRLLEIGVKGPNAESDLLTETEKENNNRLVKLLNFFRFK